MQIVTGWKASLMSQRIYRKFKRHLLLCPAVTVFRAYARHRVHMKGMTDVTVQCDGQTTRFPAYVTERKCPSIMVRIWLKKIWLEWLAVRQLSHGSTHL